MSTIDLPRAAPRRNLAGVGMGLTVVRTILDRLYLACGYLAALSMTGIFLVTLMQIVGRLLGIGLRGATDYAGYLMAASTFLALAHALNHGAHIRVETFSAMLGRYRTYADMWALGCTAAIAAWFAYHASSTVYWSYKLGDVSTGMDATPLWIPQSSMALGAVLFAVALADNFLRLVFSGRHGIKPSSGNL